MTQGYLIGRMGGIAGVLSKVRWSTILTSFSERFRTVAWSGRSSQPLTSVRVGSTGSQSLPEAGEKALQGFLLRELNWLFENAAQKSWLP